jgi:uncharacterized protein YukE
MVIQVDNQALQDQANRIDRWAEDLKGEVRSRAQSELQAVSNIPNFQGQAREAYVARFQELTEGINRAIEQISDQQLRGIRRNLSRIGIAFQDLDSNLGRQ